MKDRGLVERRGSEGEWTRIAIYRIRDDGSMSYGRFKYAAHFDGGYKKFSGVSDDGTKAVVGQLIGRSEVSSPGPNPPVDPIVALLRLPRNQAEAALARLGIVEDPGSLQLEDKVGSKSGKPYTLDAYDSGKVKFFYKEDKLISMELWLSEGYDGALPLGLGRNMGHKEARTATEGREYIRTSHGYTSAGWGSVFSSEYPLSHGVFVETKSRKSKELELVRVYARSDPD